MPGLFDADGIVADDCAEWPLTWRSVQVVVTSPPCSARMSNVIENPLARSGGPHVSTICSKSALRYLTTPPALVT